MAVNLRYQVRQLYKNLMFLGREYPKGQDYFRQRCKAAFVKHKDETDPEVIKTLIARGDYVIKELEALYMLRKYRTLKKRYYPS
ncbi:ETFRF1 [Branchiostoma lanceolatum]|uniref:ETFRF1 protein n=1 Tax=Branchiostoma lanceolatum TaxID=7740 RepID=A0A8J9ZJY2_BRALA|nr:ETFRF1 [Branchiostoma lanceolatum]